MSVIQQNSIICQCGSSIRNEPANIRQHQKTLKHIKYIEKENIVENKDNSQMNEMNNDEKAERLEKKTQASANALQYVISELNKKPTLVKKCIRN